MLTEEDLLKSLAELEKADKKGSLGDPDGDLSEEGKTLSNPAKGPLSKTYSASDEGSPDNSSDDGSQVNKNTKPKVEMSMKDKVEMSHANKANKSFADLFAGDDDIKKAVEVSPFFESLTDQTTNALDNLKKSVSEVETGLSSFSQNQRAFNQNLAKGFIHLGNMMIEIKKSLDNRPVDPMRKSFLSEAEYAKTPGEQGQGPSYKEISDWLMRKSMAREIPIHLVTLFEQEKSLDVLPGELRKSLVNDLMKAS